MTISSTLRKAGPYVGNGVATSFAFAFKVFATSDLVVTRTTVATGTESVLVLTTDYTVSLNADQNANPGGTVTYNPSGTPMASTHNLTITSDVPQTQGTDIPNAGGFYPEVIENALDKSTILAQQIEEILGRTIHFPVADSNTPQLPSFSVRANRALGFDSLGALTTYATTAPVDTSSFAVSVKDFGAVGDGVTNDIAAIQAAIDFLGSTPGVVHFPVGAYRINSKININGKRGIRLTGTGPTNLGDLGTVIRWYGGASSGACMSMDGANEINVENLTFQYYTAAYDGNLIDLDSSVGGADAFNIRFSHCAFNGSSASIDSAAALVNLRLTYGISFDHCSFRYAVLGIGCSGTSNSVISVRDCFFEGATLTTACISARSGAWVVESCVHQCDTSVVLTPFLKLAGELNGLVVSGCLLGVDGANAATPSANAIIDLTGAVNTGVSIHGNLFACAKGTGVKLHASAASSQGVSIVGNTFGGLDNCYRLGAADNVFLHANGIGATAEDYGTATNVLRYTEPSWTPTITNTTGAYGSITVTQNKATRVGRLCHVTFRVAVTTGTASSEMNVTLPYAATADAVGIGTDTTNGNAVQVVIVAGDSHARVKLMDGTAMSANATFKIAVTYTV